MKERVELGDEVKDKITGYAGIVTGISDYLTSERRMGVQPRFEKGKDFDPGQTFDESSLNIVKKNKVKLERPPIAGHVNLNDKVVETITGFKGTVVALTHYMFGCRRVTIRPKILKGEYQEGRIFDEVNIKVIKAAKPLKERKTGGPGLYGNLELR